MITGISIFSASYGLAAFIGLILVSENNCDGKCQTVGGELLIPVLGPFLAAGTVDNGGSALAIWGIVQGVGLGLMIGGIVKYNASRRRAEEQGYIVLDLPSLDAALECAARCPAAATGAVEVRPLSLEVRIKVVD